MDSHGVIWCEDPALRMVAERLAEVNACLKSNDRMIHLFL